MGLRDREWTWFCFWEKTITVLIWGGWTSKKGKLSSLLSFFLTGFNFVFFNETCEVKPMLLLQSFIQVVSFIWPSDWEEESRRSSEQRQLEVVSWCCLLPSERLVTRCCESRSRWRKCTFVPSPGMQQSQPGLRYSSYERCADCARLEHCSLRDTEACLPWALCSPGWKQLISNRLHSNHLLVQKHCLVFQFSLSHCLPEGLFTARSLIWVGSVPVEEVNCQDRKTPW